MAIMILWGADKDEKLKESERVLALKALYEVVETEFINEQGKIYEKYLVKNTTEEERKIISECQIELLLQKRSGILLTIT